MNGESDNLSALDLSRLLSLSRGLYHRVAQKVGCDPSYVSRVARGERKSEVVSEALREEMQRTWAKANEGAGESADKGARRKVRAVSA